MRIRGFLVGYFLMLLGMLVAAALFCRYMTGIDMLPEGLTLSGAFVGFFTMLYAFFVAQRGYNVRQLASEAGNVELVKQCRGHMGRRTMGFCNLAVCDYGVVVDSGQGGVRSIMYQDMSDFSVLPFEVRFCYGRMKCRFSFDRKLDVSLVARMMESFMDIFAKQ